MSQEFIELCKYIERAGLEELRQLIPMLETRKEQLENGKWREVFRENHGFPVSTTNFKSNYDVVTNELDGLSVEFASEADSDNNVEFEITPMSVAVAIYTDEADHITNTWEVFGSPDDFSISDSSYNEDPESQLRMPNHVLEYMLFLWKGFLSIVDPDSNNTVGKIGNSEINNIHNVLDNLESSKGKEEIAF